MSIENHRDPDDDDVSIVPYGLAWGVLVVLCLLVLSLLLAK